jgi:pimeloyl-ACP methyl ester carboxylesterase
MRKWLWLMLVLAGCADNPKAESKDHALKAESAGDTVVVDTLVKQLPSVMLKRDTVLTIADENRKVAITIQLPDSGVVKGCILLLHGWNLPALDWCTKMTFCKRATEMGYALVIPDFGKSTYQWQNYPETIEKLRPYPTRQWMYETMMPQLQSLGLLAKTGNNYVCGISTGARGAAFFALEHPDVFRACAALSGDFDQTKLQPGEYINTNVYGPLEKFRDRWTGDDNIFNRAAEYTVPTYLGHGKSDKVCPPFHSLEFAAELKRVHPELQVVVSNPQAAHDYAFWESETEPVLQFFQKFWK